MDYKLFGKIIQDFFNEYLVKIYLKIKNKEILIKGNYSFPNFIRVGESPHHFMAELLGATEIKNEDEINLDLRDSREKFDNTIYFINPGIKIEEKKKPVFDVKKAKNFGLSTLTICTDFDEELFSKKVNFPLSRTILIGESVDNIINILPDIQSAYFRKLNFIRTDLFRIYFKYISTAIIVKKSITEKNLRHWLQSVCEKYYSPPSLDIFGLNIGHSSSVDLFAKQLLSLTDQNVTEPLLDSFIQNHANFFSKALGYKKCLSQKNLKWIEKQYSDDPDESIPDYLMERDDGYFDILDLKRSALHYENLVIGGKKRPRFNKYVSELIGQLNTYDRYFDNRVNTQWVYEQYKVKVKNPLLIGIVGNYDNFKREDIDLTLRVYSDRIVIFSYNDLINLLRAVDN